MYLEKAKANFQKLGILCSEELFIEYPSVIAIEKKFRVVPIYVCNVAKIN